MDWLDPIYNPWLPQTDRYDRYDRSGTIPGFGGAAPTFGAYPFAAQPWGSTVYSNAAAPMIMQALSSAMSWAGVPGQISDSLILPSGAAGYSFDFGTGVVNSSPAERLRTPVNTQLTRNIQAAQVMAMTAGMSSATYGPIMTALESVPMGMDLFQYLRDNPMTQGPLATAYQKFGTYGPGDRGALGQALMMYGPQFVNMMNGPDYSTSIYSKEAGQAAARNLTSMYYAMDALMYDERGNPRANTLGNGSESGNVATFLPILLANPDIAKQLGDVGSTIESRGELMRKLAQKEKEHNENRGNLETIRALTRAHTGKITEADKARRDELLKEARVLNLRNNVAEYMADISMLSDLEGDAISRFRSQYNDSHATSGVIGRVKGNEAAAREYENATRKKWVDSSYAGSHDKAWDTTSRTYGSAFSDYISGQVRETRVMLEGAAAFMREDAKWNAIKGVAKEMEGPDFDPETIESKATADAWVEEKRKNLKGQDLEDFNRKLEARQEVAVDRLQNTDTDFLKVQERLRHITDIETRAKELGTEMSGANEHYARLDDATATKLRTALKATIKGSDDADTKKKIQEVIHTARISRKTADTLESLTADELVKVAQSRASDLEGNDSKEARDLRDLRNKLSSSTNDARAKAAAAVEGYAENMGALNAAADQLADMGIDRSTAERIVASMAGKEALGNISQVQDKSGKMTTAGAQILNAIGEDLATARVTGRSAGFSERETGQRILGSAANLQTRLGYDRQDIAEGRGAGEATILSATFRTRADASAAALEGATQEERRRYADAAQALFEQSVGTTSDRAFVALRAALKDNLITEKQAKEIQQGLEAGSFEARSAAYNTLLRHDPRAAEIVRGTNLQAYRDAQSQLSADEQRARAQYLGQVTSANIDRRREDAATSYMLDASREMLYAQGWSGERVSAEEDTLRAEHISMAMAGKGIKGAQEMLTSAADKAERDFLKSIGKTNVNELTAEEKQQLKGRRSAAQVQAFQTAADLGVVDQDVYAETMRDANTVAAKTLLDERALDKNDEDYRRMVATRKIDALETLAHTMGGEGDLKYVETLRSELAKGNIEAVETSIGQVANGKSEAARSALGSVDRQLDEEQSAADERREAIESEAQRYANKAAGLPDLSMGEAERVGTPSQSDRYAAGADVIATARATAREEMKQERANTANEDVNGAPTPESSSKGSEVLSNIQDGVGAIVAILTAAKSAEGRAEGSPDLDKAVEAALSKLADKIGEAIKTALVQGLSGQ